MSYWADVTAKLGGYRFRSFSVRAVSDYMDAWWFATVMVFFVSVKATILVGILENVIVLLNIVGNRSSFNDSYFELNLWRNMGQAAQRRNWFQSGFEAVGFSLSKVGYYYGIVFAYGSKSYVLLGLKKSVMKLIRRLLFSVLQIGFRFSLFVILFYGQSTFQTAALSLLKSI